jgi:hypothetical protein
MHDETLIPLPMAGNSEGKNAAGIPVRAGMLFIPDISGFTYLVHFTDLQTGRPVTVYRRILLPV